MLVPSRGKTVVRKTPPAKLIRRTGDVVPPCIIGRSGILYPLSFGAFTRILTDLVSFAPLGFYSRAETVYA